MVTFGIEEEFFLVDRSTLKPTSVAERVLGDLPTALSNPGRVSSEFLACQIERSTPILTDMESAATDLSHFRGVMHSAARLRGVTVIGTGTTFDVPASPTVTENDRYRKVVRDICGILHDHQICGTHVHVGVPNRDAGVRALNHVRVWLPTLMALFGNSPFWRGTSTGFDSWRAVIMRRWTTTGCPPYFLDAADYDRRIRQLAGMGATTDVATIAWCARLSEVHPTLEVRVADAQLDVESTILLAAITRGLVATALREAEQDISSPTLEPEFLDAALWHASRDGIRGDLLNPITTELTSAREVTHTLFRHIGESLCDAGDGQRVAESLDRLWSRGTGAQQQEHAFAAGGLPGLRSLLESAYVR